MRITVEVSEQDLRKMEQAAEIAGLTTEQWAAAQIRLALPDPLVFVPVRCREES